MMSDERRNQITAYATAALTGLLASGSLRDMPGITPLDKQRSLARLCLDIAAEMDRTQQSDAAKRPG